MRQWGSVTGMAVDKVSSPEWNWGQMAHVNSLLNLPNSCEGDRGPLVAAFSKHLLICRSHLQIWLPGGLSRVRRSAALLFPYWAPQWGQWRDKDKGARAVTAAPKKLPDLHLI